MFGKPEWFRKKRFGWGLHPVTRQGWIYAAIWGGVISLPVVMLVSRQQTPEALIWFALSTGALIWDSRHIMKQMDDARLAEPPTPEQPHATADYDLYIGDDDQVA